MIVRNHTLSDTELMLFGGGAGFCIGASTSLVFLLDRVRADDLRLCGGLSLLVRRSRRGARRMGGTDRLCHHRLCVRNRAWSLLGKMVDDLGCPAARAAERPSLGAKRANGHPYRLPRAVGRFPPLRAALCMPSIQPTHEILLDGGLWSHECEETAIQRSSIVIRRVVTLR